MKAPNIVHLASKLQKKTVVSSLSLPFYIKRTPKTPEQVLHWQASLALKIPGNTPLTF
jgi:hypothetical protein